MVILRSECNKIGGGLKQEKLKRECFYSDLKLAIMSISDLHKYVQEVKHMGVVNNKDSVVKLYDLMDEVSEYIESRIMMRGPGNLFESEKLVDDIAS